MAKIVTLEILVDSDDESEIADGLNDMLRTAQIPVDPDDADARNWIIDWRRFVDFGGQRTDIRPF